MRRWAKVLQAFRIFRGETRWQFLKVYVCTWLQCVQCKTKGHPTKKDSVWLDCALMSCQTGRPLLPFPWMSLTPPSSPSLASSQNHEYRFDISTSVSPGAYLETWNFPTINLANCWWKTAIAMLSRWRHIFSWFPSTVWKSGELLHLNTDLGQPLLFPQGSVKRFWQLD